MILTSGLTSITSQSVSIFCDSASPFISLAFCFDDLAVNFTPCQGFNIGTEQFAHRVVVFVVDVNESRKRCGEEHCFCDKKNRFFILLKFKVRMIEVYICPSSACMASMIVEMSYLITFSVSFSTIYRLFSRMSTSKYIVCTGRLRSANGIPSQLKKCK